MIGPSSSHTAGAVRIGRITRDLLGYQPKHAHVELHGSFAATGKGHATDRALVAGLLGFPPDDLRLKDSLLLAVEAGLTVRFTEVDLGEDAHPNSARIRAMDEDGVTVTVIAASIGGGTIQIRVIDCYHTSFGGEMETLILWHQDKSGFLAKVTTLLACVEANIATIRTSRQTRGSDALTVLEVDTPLPDDCLSLLGNLSSVEKLRTVHPLS